MLPGNISKLFGLDWQLHPARLYLDCRLARGAIPHFHMYYRKMEVSDHLARVDLSTKLPVFRYILKRTVQLGLHPDLYLRAIG